MSNTKWVIIIKPDNHSSFFDYNDIFIKLVQIVQIVQTVESHSSIHIVVISILLMNILRTGAEHALNLYKTKKNDLK